MGAIICLSLLLLIATGCSQKPVPQIPPEIPTALPSEEEAQRVREETRETIPLLPQGERDLELEEAPPAEEVELSAEPQTRLGYRVQLFATSREELAKSRAAEFQEQFDEKVHIEYEGLLYKVRVGDCLSRDEARALRRKAVGLGYDGAFAVDTQVNVR